jgi:hypothetical protein
MTRPPPVEGVMIPNTPPEVGELLISTLRANPDLPYHHAVYALISSAPNELKLELMAAAFELATAKVTGKLAWMHLTAGSILLGVKVVKERGSFDFGPVKWPLAALFTGPPSCVTVNTPKGRRPVWVASEGLEGSVVRMSEAVALGRVLIEEFGGKVIEDREGLDVAKKSAIEDAQLKTTKNRAEARNALERLYLTVRAEERSRHGRAALVEAMPGSLQPGDRLVPEGATGPVFIVERRVNDDWVLIVGVDSGVIGPVGGWFYEDHRDVMPGQLHCGWTEAEAKPEELELAATTPGEA